VKSSKPSRDPLLTIRLQRDQVERLDRMRRRCANAAPSAARGGTITNRNVLFERALDLLRDELDAELGLPDGTHADDEFEDEED
jgi:hypothetical protein